MPKPSGIAEKEEEKQEGKEEEKEVESLQQEESQEGSDKEVVDKEESSEELSESSEEGSDGEGEKSQEELLETIKNLQEENQKLKEGGKPEAKKEESDGKQNAPNVEKFIRFVVPAVLDNFKKEAKKAYSVALEQDDEGKVKGNVVVDEDAVNKMFSNILDMMDRYMGAVFQDLIEPKTKNLEEKFSAFLKEFGDFKKSKPAQGMVGKTPLTPLKRTILRDISGARGTGNSSGAPSSKVRLTPDQEKDRQEMSESGVVLSPEEYFSKLKARQDRAKSQNKPKIPKTLREFI